MTKNHKWNTKNAPLPLFSPNCSNYEFFVAVGRSDIHIYMLIFRIGRNKDKIKNTTIHKNVSIIDKSMYCFLLY